MNLICIFDTKLVTSHTYFQKLKHYYYEALSL